MHQLSVVEVYKGCHRLDKTRQQDSVNAELLLRPPGGTQLKTLWRLPLRY